MTTKQRIHQIDRQVNAIHHRLRQLEAIDPMSAASWQAAWDKHSDLHQREAALYLERGLLQRLIETEQEWRVNQRHPSRPSGSPRFTEADCIMAHGLGVAL